MHTQLLELEALPNDQLPHAHEDWAPECATKAAPKKKAAADPAQTAFSFKNPTKTQLNKFEEVIDAMMASEAAKKWPELKTLIDRSYVNPLEKRQAILAALDNDRQLFCQLNRELSTNPRILATNRIARVVERLREYVKVGEVEKEKFGEVMTPIPLVEQILDELPKNVWTNPTLKWLDPANGCGIFPAVIVKRLMEGLQKWQPNEEYRYAHIMENMIHVCELQEKNMFLYLCAFDTKDRYFLKVYTGSFLDQDFEQHAQEQWGVTEFDIIVGNPPYQIKDGGHAASARPLYHEFVNKAADIGKETLFVIPSRWFAGGKGLDEFRNKMLTDGKTALVRDFPDATKNFPAARISGGICFLHRKTHLAGLCRFATYNEPPVVRNIAEFDILIRESAAVVLLQKVRLQHSGQPFFDSTVSSLKPFGLRTNFEDFCAEGPNTYPCQTKDGILHVKKDKVTQGHEKIPMWKSICSRAHGEDNANSEGKWTILAKSTLLPKNAVCLETYLVTGCYKTKAEAENAANFLLLKLPRFLLGLRKITQDLSKERFKWVPILDFTRAWTNEQLYKHFKLTPSEIQLIEASIK